MIGLIALQLLLASALFVWLLLWPVQNRLGLLLQYGAAISVLVAVYLAGLWTVIPRWALVIPALIGAAALVLQLRKRNAKSVPDHWKDWLILVCNVPVLVVGLWVIVQAQSGHTRPSGRFVSLEMPLRGHDLVVANGGSRLLLNAHQDTLDLSVPRHRLWYGQSYGVDIAALGAMRMTSNQVRPTNPTRYAIFGRAVHAPCTGTVIGLRDDRPDLPIPQVDRQIMEGNYVRLRCKDFDVVLAHLKQGSVPLLPDQRVSVGDVIGAVGNSGMSDEPHLHIHAQTPGTTAAPNSGNPIPMVFGGRFLARNDRI